MSFANWLLLQERERPLLSTVTKMILEPFLFPVMGNQSEKQSQRAESSGPETGLVMSSWPQSSPSQMQSCLSEALLI
jgi:hypothetical protein